MFCFFGISLAEDFFLFGTDQTVDECEQCQSVMEELENIDDDCDRHGIAFVKTQVGFLKGLLAKILEKFHVFFLGF